MLGKEPSKRCVKAIIFVLCEEEGFRVSKIQSVAAEALQWATKAFISDLFRDSVDEMVHAKLKTLYFEDLHVTVKIKGYKDDLLEVWESILPENVRARTCAKVSSG